MSYIKVSSETIRDYRRAWSEFIGNLISDVNNVAKRAKEDVEAEAQADIRNGEYDIDSIYDWKREELQDIDDWKNNTIKKFKVVEKNGDRLIDLLSDLKLYDNHENKNYVFDFSDMEKRIEYVDGQSIISIIGVGYSGECNDYHYDRNFVYPVIKYTEWMEE